MLFNVNLFIHTLEYWTNLKAFKTSPMMRTWELLSLGLNFCSLFGCQPLPFRKVSIKLITDLHLCTVHSCQKSVLISNCFQTPIEPGKSPSFIFNFLVILNLTIRFYQNFPRKLIFKKLYICFNCFILCLTVQIKSDNLWDTLNLFGNPHRHRDVR